MLLDFDAVLMLSEKHQNFSYVPCLNIQYVTLLLPLISLWLHF